MLSRLLLTTAIQFLAHLLNTQHDKTCTAALAYPNCSHHTHQRFFLAHTLSILTLRLLTDSLSTCCSVELLN